MDSLFEKWDNDGCGYLDMEDVETVMQKYKEGQENEAIVRGKTDKDQCKIFILRLIFFLALKGWNHQSFFRTASKILYIRFSQLVKFLWEWRNWVNISFV